MEPGKHIAKKSNTWWRCKRVSLDGENLRWEMDLGRSYDVLGAYQSGPHREFIQARTDADLRGFVRRWGPLFATVKDPSGCDSIQWYRQQRDQFSAFAGLLEAIEENSKRRGALSAVLSVYDHCVAEPRFFFYADRLFRGIPRNRDTWCTQASQDDIDQLCIHLVNEFPYSSEPCFRVQKRRKGEIVTVSLFMNSLFEGLLWMLWLDIFLNRPIRFCFECGALIECRTKHKRRYCDNPATRCALRAADREWKKRKRERTGGKIPNRQVRMEENERSSK
jgi:hypothetical protein